MDSVDDRDSPLDLVGAALRSARARYRLSKRELAELLGVHRGVVARWESGYGPPALDRVDGLLRLLGYRVVVVPCDPAAPVPGANDSTPHVRDRAGRRYPAHLPASCPGGGLLVNDASRFLGEKNPYGPGWTFARRPEDRRSFPTRIGEGNPDPPG
ncbi:helix-turn-helix transcriptional regulator [Phycicoccus sp. CSK15P-2]|uniref:helix-turn-helix domain-containing protein n=1 Tax=Phycicoccus sp. CSK15P-2 TaxID=2807627 RepID=UPI00194F05DF|nr:helix-turn-helix transcriptional regulator [Phycicoccus sp. CSK15P-2]MBM6405454.1 helix-turn-helix transcriptional regulator [Phycicoccus sp. CSK15P-2]